MQSLSHSLSISVVICFLCAMLGICVSVRTQCEWAWYWLSSCTYPYIYSDKHTSAREEIKISPLTYLEDARFARQLHNYFHLRESRSLASTNLSGSRHLILLARTGMYPAVKTFLSNFFYLLCSSCTCQIRTMHHIKVLFCVLF